MLAALASPAHRETHHGIPRCLLKVYDRAQGPGLEPADLQAWFDCRKKAYRYGVDSDVSRNELMVLIEGSTVELASEAHRSGHSQAGYFARWGRLGGLETLRRYGQPWFSLLGRRRWGRVSPGALARYRAELDTKVGVV